MSAVSGSGMASELTLFTPNVQQGQSPLLTLPGELRNKIYSYVFDTELEISTSKQYPGFAFLSSPPDPSCKCCPRSKPEPGPSPTSSGAPWQGLVLACRALYAEAYPLIFSMPPEFSFRDFWAMENFCAYIPEEYRTMMPTIRLRLSYPNERDLRAISRIESQGLVFKAMFPAVKVAKLVQVLLSKPGGGYSSGTELYWEEWLSGSWENGVTVVDHVYTPSLLVRISVS